MIFPLHLNVKVFLMDVHLTTTFKNQLYAFNVYFVTLFHQPRMFVIVDIPLPHFTEYKSLPIR